MNAKIQKEYRLVIGTNVEGMTIDDIDKAAFELEQYGNSSLMMTKIEEVIKNENLQKL